MKTMGGSDQAKEGKGPDEIPEASKVTQDLLKIQQQLNASGITKPTEEQVLELTMNHPSHSCSQGNDQ